jgi:predicted Fe-S protein YdhL (DUF1289 family)
LRRIGNWSVLNNKTKNEIWSAVPNVDLPGIAVSKQKINKCSFKSEIVDVSASFFTHLVL